MQNPTVPISYDPDTLTIMHFSDLNTVKAAPEQCLGHTTLLTLCIHQIYALWLYTYISRGGEVTHPYDYDMPNFWTPTTSNQSDEPPLVPCGHGSNSLNILHLPDLAPIDTSGDVGHSTICTLQLDPDSQLGLKATTNHPYFVASYANITGLLRGVEGNFKPRRIRKQLGQLASNRPDRRLTTEDLPH